MPKVTPVRKAVNINKTLSRCDELNKVFELKNLRGSRCGLSRSKGKRVDFSTPYSAQFDEMIV